MSSDDDFDDEDQSSDGGPDAFDDDDEDSESTGEEAWNEESIRDSYYPYNDGYDAEEEDVEEERYEKPKKKKKKKPREPLVMHLKYPHFFQTWRFFCGCNHPRDSFLCWFNPCNCLLLPCLNPCFICGSKSCWYFFIKCVGYLELASLNIACILNFVGYIFYMFLASFSGMVDKYDDDVYSLSPWIYIGFSLQLLSCCIIPLVSYFLRFWNIYYVSDENRRVCIRWTVYFITSFFVNVYIFCCLCGVFGSLGIYDTIRMVLYLFDRGNSIEVEFFFYLVLVLWSLLDMVLYVIAFLCHVWITTAFICVLCTCCERPYRRTGLVHVVKNLVPFPNWGINKKWWRKLFGGGDAELGLVENGEEGGSDEVEEEEGEEDDGETPRL